MIQTTLHRLVTSIKTLYSNNVYITIGVIYYQRMKIHDWRLQFYVIFLYFDANFS